MKKKKKKIKFFNIFIMIIFLLAIIFIYNKYKDNVSIKQILNHTESLNGVVTSYTVYGTHLNITGNIDIDNANKVELVLKRGLNKEDVYDVDYNIDDKLNFRLSENINGGIDLEELNSNNYIILLKIDDKYYNLINETKYPSITYYTITKHGHNNKVLIDFKNQYQKDYFNIKIDSTYNSDYYDIVIDAGHGGNDSGAVAGMEHEADYTLSYALALKKELDKLGLKVKLTRDSDVSLDAYGENGRAVIPNKVNAKYLISIHLNSNEVNIFSGFEIYKAKNTNNDFANILKDNIIDDVGIYPSNNNSMKVLDGIYERVYKADEVATSVSEARNGGYNPYPITTSTNYLYMIRETGGIMTNAYIDGRNKNMEKNPYYDSNIGCESYLLEIGYLINDNDLNIIKNKQDEYIEAIKKSIKEYLKL